MNDITLLILSLPLMGCSYYFPPRQIDRSLLQGPIPKPVLWIAGEMAHVVFMLSKKRVENSEIYVDFCFRQKRKKSQFFYLRDFSPSPLAGGHLIEKG